MFVVQSQSDSESPILSNGLVVKQSPACKNLIREAEYIVGIRRQSTIIEVANWGVSVRVVVNCRVCKSALAL
jgi:hypothetical protein